MFRFFIFFAIAPFLIHAQIDHWESVVLEGDQFQYIVPNSQLETTWINLEFDDSSWNKGNSGFGYGDGDDNVILESVISVYIRKVFVVANLEDIEEIILHMDYDDGFIAYLNGVEVARSLVSGNPPAYNQGSDGLHEALLYQGIQPETFGIDYGLLVEGENILAIQVHNESNQSSDLTAIPFLSLGIKSNTFTYRPIPVWFSPPTTFDFSNSKLPIVSINTNGQQIFNDPKIKAEIGIIYNGEGNVNRISDPFNEYHGSCGIEIRGESSQYFDKKSYLFEFWDEEGLDMDTSFLNFPAEEDFILYGPFSDKSLLNNVLTMKLGNDMGRYSSRTRFVELIINDQYQGLYVVMEKIKRGKDRVDISKLNTDEISGDDLTGGYIVRVDKGVYQGWESKYNSYGTNNKLFFQYYYPNQYDIQVEQKGYIKGYFDEFEQAVASVNYANSLGKKYSDYINIKSFVDNFIINEFSKNVDGYRLSSYFHKDKKSKGGKLVAGPLWDFNLSFGNADYCGGDNENGWILYQCDHGGIPFWWNRMLNDDFFKNALRCRWESLRENVLATDHIHNFLDSMNLVLGESADRNFEKWQILGQYVWPNGWYYAQAQSHDEILEIMKARIENRLNWLDLNIPGIAENCTYYDEFDELAGNDPNIPDPEDYKVYVFPNPTVENIHIESEKTIEKIFIYNALGQLVLQSKVDEKIYTIPLNDQFAKGQYILKVQFDNGFVHKPIIIL